MGDYRPDTCANCRTDTWCEIRSDGKPQCRACKVEMFFDRVLYAPLGYRLLPWQRKILRDIYGTSDVEGYRKYRRAYISVPKKQGKSFLAGGLPLYHLLMEDEHNPEAYGAAASREQAGIVFKSAALLARANPLLYPRRLRILESTKRIIRCDGGGTYAVLSADGDVQDGIEPSLAIIDELHRWKTKKAETLFDVITKGTISRATPLVFEITTAGEEHESPLWFSEHEYARHILDGSIESGTFYSAIWAADQKRIQGEPDYWKSREARVQANPSHEDNGGFLKDERLVEELNIAVAKPEKYSDFLRYHLNVPVAKGESPIIDMPLWCQGGGEVDLRTWPEYDVELLISKWGLIERPCFVGVDLAWTTDLTAMCCLFPPDERDAMWKLLSFAWVPQDQIERIERLTRAPISDWVRRGFLGTVPGPKMELLVLEDKIRWAHQMFGVREVMFDPWGGMKRSAEVLAAQDDLTCVEISQKIPQLTAATKEFLALYMSRQLLHGNNPVMNWNVSCLSLQSDQNDNVKPCKPKRDSASKRIDLVSATINAMARAMLLPQESVYATRGPLTIDMPLYA